MEAASRRILHGKLRLGISHPVQRSTALIPRMRGKRGIPRLRAARMTSSTTRTVTLSVSPPSPGIHLDDEAATYLADNALNRLQASMGALIAQGLLSGTFTYQEYTPAVSLFWTITVTESPATSQCCPQG